jgi:D-Tyr-tRNAtyr deacylase
MRVLIQRVSKASVSIDGECAGKIEEGIVILLGITDSDTPKDSETLARKCANLHNSIL